MVRQSKVWGEGTRLALRDSGNQKICTGEMPVPYYRDGIRDRDDRGGVTEGIADWRSQRITEKSTNGKGGETADDSGWIPAFVVHYQGVGRFVAAITRTCTFTHK